MMSRKWSSPAPASSIKLPISAKSGHIGEVGLHFGEVGPRLRNVALRFGGMCQDGWPSVGGLDHFG
jgi:hypothetical protein